MIQLLRILSRLFLLGLGIALLAYWWLERVPEPQKQARLNGQIDRILIEKSSRKLTLFQQGKPVREYRIALGFAPDGDKIRQGDGKTPLGIYSINRRNGRSKYTLSLGIDYPKPADVARAKASGYSPGGDIFIHGQPNNMPKGLMAKGDWTAGCIAVKNSEIREMWDVVPIGTEVEIRP